MWIEEIEIEVQRKKIKNLHLHVKPPDGRVILTAPYRISNDIIEGFARANLEWIRGCREKYINAPPVPERKYISGEAVYIWGERYTLEVIPAPQNTFRIIGDRAILAMCPESSVEQRVKFMRGQYRKMLCEEIERLLPEWEERTGLKCEQWRTKYMTTRWGTCNPSAKRIWFSLQLAAHPKICLEYIILHESAHLKVRNHGADFIAIMDRYMPDWREIKKVLNTQLEGDLGM